MSRNVAFLTLLSICWSGTLIAKETYLDCRTLNDHTNAWTTYKITLDEANKTAVYSSSSPLSHGETYTRPAQFTQTDVAFNWREPVTGFTFQYHIDRTNLAFSESAVGGTGQVDKGDCTIAKPVERKF